MSDEQVLSVAGDVPAAVRIGAGACEGPAAGSFCCSWEQANPLEIAMTKAAIPFLMCEVLLGECVGWSPQGDRSKRSLLFSLVQSLSKRHAGGGALVRTENRHKVMSEDLGRVTTCHAWRIASVSHRTSPHGCRRMSVACRLLWLRSMGRTQIALTWAFAAAFVLASTGCGHKACDEALKICLADNGNESKAPRPQAASMDGLKTALARLQAKVEWPTEGPGDPLATRASKVDKEEVEKTAKRKSGVAEQTSDSSRT